MTEKQEEEITSSIETSYQALEDVIAMLEAKQELRQLSLTNEALSRG